jgi:tetraacyldisaccharide 4'-kinase
LDFSKRRMPTTKRYLFLKQLLHPILYAASGLYGSGVRFRLWLYYRHLLPIRSLPLKVISVGNLTAGGTGKTPHTALLACYLREKGIKTAVLSRGYRGTKEKKGAVISNTESIQGTLEDGGEEPYWLAQELPGVPVVVGRNRFRSGLLCFQQWQTEWVILDDGFQHLILKREINLLLLSSHFPFGSERLLPLGFLREPIEEMRRSDIIVVTHAEGLNSFQRKEIGGEIRSRVSSIPFFFSEHKPRRLRSYPDKKEIPLSELAGKRVVAFCGLANPDSLMFSLQQLQAEPVQLVKFPDHHYYREKDKRHLETLSRSLRVRWLVTTEKDDLKLGQWVPADLQILVLGIEVEIQDPAFWELLDRKIEQEARGLRREI